jgi:hypothetical protein
MTAQSDTRNKSVLTNCGEGLLGTANSRVCVCISHTRFQLSKVNDSRTEGCARSAGDRVANHKSQLPEANACSASLICEAHDVTTQAFSTAAWLRLQQGSRLRWRLGGGWLGLGITRHKRLICRCLIRPARRGTYLGVLESRKCADAYAVQCIRCKWRT